MFPAKTAEALPQADDAAVPGDAVARVTRRPPASPSPPRDPPCAPPCTPARVPGRRAARTHDRVPHIRDDLREQVAANRPVLTGLAVTLQALTGFVAVFTYVAPMLTTVSGFSPGWVSVALVGYGLGTVAGNVLVGRVPPAAIPRVLPVPLAVLTLVLMLQGVLLRSQPAALVGLVVLGAATFVVVPLLQTWLVGQVGEAATGLVAAVNIAVAGIAGALGAGLGGVVLAAGLGLVAIGPIAALPVLGATAAAVGLRRCSTRVSCPR